MVLSSLDIFGSWLYHWEPRSSCPMMALCCAMYLPLLWQFCILFFVISCRPTVPLHSLAIGWEWISLWIDKQGFLHFVSLTRFLGSFRHCMWHSGVKIHLISQDSNLSKTQQHKEMILGMWWGRLSKGRYWSLKIVAIFFHFYHVHSNIKIEFLQNDNLVN